MNADGPLRAALSRRQFLDCSARQAAGVAATMVGLSTSNAIAAPSERVRVGVIGVRNQGRQLAAALAAFPDVDVRTLCDVDPQVLPAAVASVTTQAAPAPRCEADFRRLLDDPALDAVVIATPDHWHATQAVLACQAGKHVYLESPATWSLGEGAQLLAAAESSGRVVYCGLQQRSGAHFQEAVEYVRQGQLGAVRLARAWMVHRRKPIPVKADGPAPAGVNYDLWTGPAPARRFNANRFHFNWRWFWDYGGGELAHWGVHLLDVARWGLGVEWPIRVAASGGKFSLEDATETPDALSVQYVYPGMTLLWEHRLWSTHGVEGRSNGVAFYGDQGVLVVDRGGWKVYDSSTPAAGQPVGDLLAAHLRTFVDAVRQQRPAPDALRDAVVSSGLCHLGNVAHRVGREITFDPVRQDCGRLTAANELLQRAPRRPWTLDGSV